MYESVSGLAFSNRNWIENGSVIVTGGDDERSVVAEETGTVDFIFTPTSIYPPGRNRTCCFSFLIAVADHNAQQRVFGKK